MAARYTWRKGKTRESMMRMMPSYTLHQGTDQWIVCVQQHANGWYWYGLGRNTAHDMKSLDEAKADALAFVKSQATTTQR